MNTLATDELWRFALAAIPLAVIVAVVCRCLPCRPTTRHTLWLTLLGLFLIAPLLPQAPVPDLASWLEPENGTEAVLPPLTAAVEEPVKTGEMKKDPPPAPPTELAGDPSPGTAVARALHPLSDAWQPFMIRPAAAESAPAPTTVARIPGSSDRSSGPEPDGGGPPAPRSGELHPRQFATTQSAPNNVDAARLRLPLPHRRDADGGPAAEIPPAPLAEGRRAAVVEPDAAPDSDRSVTVWAQWLVHLRTIRDAVMDLPPIPTSVWAGGAALLMVITAARALRFRNLLKSAEPPSPVTLHHVAQAAASLGLRRAPQTLMVNQRISPMVWCGRRVCLLLPDGLWRDLDEAGRRAVVHHELAHLRRHDHWVCYLAMIVGWLYWWHPVVWWVRRQLREEADLCCDVWVTSLLPGARRAYATALLETKKYTCGFRPVAPITGLGVSTTRAKRFARRLTMVMSHQLTPKLTYGGIVLACALAAGSWLAAPTLACPPKDKEAAKAPKAAEYTAAAEAAVKALEAIKIADPAVIAVAMPGPPDPPDPAQRAESTFERYLKYGDPEVLKQMGLDERMARLEKQLDALMRKLGQWGEHLDIDLSGIEIPALPELADIKEMPQFADLPKDVTKILESKLGPTYQKALGSYMAMAGPPPAPQQQETIVRSFKLPEGKLEALTDLMVRADVPVLVSPGEGFIEVHGTPQQQIIFEAFCLMINGEDQVKQYPLSAGKLEALSKLMVRPDVPILVSPGDKGIEVNGTDLEQHVFEAFIKMIEPGEAAKGKVEGGTYVPAPAPPKAPKAMKAPEPPKPPKAMKTPKAPKAPKALEYERKAVAQVQELQKLSAMLKSLEKQAGSLEMKAEQVWQKAEELEQKAEELEAQADEIEDSADDLTGEARLKAIQHANELMLKAQQLENESRLLEAKAEALEEQAEALEEKAEELEERIEEIQEAAGSHDDDDDEDEDEDDC
jgi:beta-lactamase regulating signal transducer with metallopeptidase domain